MDDAKGKEVGELLATAPIGTIVEHGRDGDGRFGQIKSAPSGKFWWRRAWADGAWWSWCDVSVIDIDVIRRPARIVPASEADNNPATRGPIVATETRTGSARAILDRAAAALAAIGVECRVSEHRETAVAAALAGAPVLSLSLSATVYAPDEVIP